MANDNTVVTVISQIPGNPAKAQEACLVVINGLELGKKYSLIKSPIVIGRSSKGDIQIDEESISRNHAAIEVRDDSIYVRDMGSTNGTYVNDRQVTEHQLRDGDQLKVGRTIFKFLSGSNIEAAYHDEIYRLTTTDGLTQIYNKRFFLQEMERELSRCLRYNRNLSVVMCDIDHFKPINDTYGHLAGDHILKQVAQRISNHIRRDDIFARYGGEEFILLLPEVGKEMAAQTAEKLRELVATTIYTFDGVDIPITLSMGVADIAEFRHKIDNEEVSSVNLEQSCFEFIKIADERLYAAKEGGRNRVVSQD